MKRAKLIVIRLLVCGVVAGVIAAALLLDTTAYADDKPGSQAVQSAKTTSDLMLATILAALGQEFAETNAENVEQGKQSISLIFNDKNQDMRLVGVLNPLRASDIPQDAFEEAALAFAMRGKNFVDVQRVDDKWYYRRSMALSNFHPSCVLCHSNFGPVNDKKWVGALMLRVPIGN